MDVSLVVTRLLHIISGTFWVGAAIYLAILLEPRIRSSADGLERELLRRTSKLNSLFITGAAIIAMLTGFALVSMTPGRSMSQLGESGWGMMILIGLMASIAAFAVSGFAGAATAKLRRETESGTGDEAQLMVMRQKLTMLGYVNAVLVVVAVGSMSIARFV